MSHLNHLQEEKRQALSRIIEHWRCDHPRALKRGGAQEEGRKENRRVEEGDRGGVRLWESGKQKLLSFDIY